MREVEFIVTENRPLAAGIFEMVLSGPMSDVERPGQFINIRLDGLFLRRPISVSDIGRDGLTIVYKVVGRGTEQLSCMGPGQRLSALSALGNGFDVSRAGERPLLVGGGVGVPPLYLLARALSALGRRPTVVLGFNTAKEAFYVSKFAAIADVAVTTVDGSIGRRGFVTDAMEGLGYSYFYACGPEPMLKAVCERSAGSGELSFEERMGCGFGACMGCSCETKYGAKRICRDGPVLRKEEIVW